MAGPQPGCRMCVCIDKPQLVSTPDNFRAALHPGEYYLVNLAMRRNVMRLFEL